MSNRKVAFLINSLTNGGAERVVSNVLSALYKDGYDIELICLEKDNFYKLDESIKITYLSNFNGKEKSVLKLFMIFVLAFKLKSHVKKNGISLLQSHLFRANYVNVLAKLFGSKHIVQLVSTVSAKAKYSDGSLSSKINLFLINNLYKYANLLIFKANAMRDEYFKAFNLQNRSIVIYNPIDIKTIDRLKLRDSEIKFGFKKNKKYIISMGRFHKQKRQKDLIDAFVKIEKEYYDVELIFLGDGEERSFLENYVKKIKLENKIHFLGNVLNPYYYLYHSYIYISTSSSEGFPNSLVEAMCCELPVISTDCPTGPREILAPNHTKVLFLKSNYELAEYGILAPVGNIKILSQCLKLILSKNIYFKYKGTTRKRVYDFTFNKTLNRYKEILN